VSISLQLQTWEIIIIIFPIGSLVTGKKTLGKFSGKDLLVEILLRLSQVSFCVEITTKCYCLLYIPFKSWVQDDNLYGTISFPLPPRAVNSIVLVNKYFSLFIEKILS
jgi:hypothetical protein